MFGLRFIAGRCFAMKRQFLEIGRNLVRASLYFAPPPRAM